MKSLPVVIPVKALSDAKLRLAGALGAEQRARLVLAMLADVLETLAQVPVVGPVRVVTPDAEVAAMAESRGAIVVGENGSTGLNGAVARGLADPGVRAAGQALVLPGDVPLASAEEIREIAEAAGPSGARRVTLVPDRDDRGTNALLLAPPGIIEPQFGPCSYTQHLNRAVAGRIDVQVLRLPGLALDIDAPADLDELLRRREGSQRYQFLRGGAHKRQGAVAHE